MSASAPLLQRTAPGDALGVAGRRVTVVGGARSGLAAARLLARHGAEVFLTDAGPGSDAARAELAEAGAAFEFGGHTARALDADLLILSPGVPTASPLVQSALRQGVPVRSEIELASAVCPGPIVAVTGSNGKTTTVTLLDHVFATAGRAHVTAGNIGAPFSDYVDAMDAETVALLEISSFQLDHVDRFRPRVAVLLNVTPDHLDRYDHDFAAYAEAKFRLFENMGPGDWLVYNADDPVVADAVARRAPAQGLVPLAVSTEGPVERGAFVEDGRVVLLLPDSSPDSPVNRHDLMPTSDLALRGTHNLYNSLAAAIVARAMEIRSDVVRESLTSFEGVPHRLERVRTVRGVHYVNDSKATNVNAVWYALESFPEGERRVVLIAGGRDKGNDYGPLRDLVRDRVKGIVAIGEGADAVERELADALGDDAPELAHASTMEQAIQYASVLAEAGDTVLLSPACASFDMFDSYEHRGDTFKRLVDAL